jgi:Na+-driven multidrug efflux pump
MLPTRLRIVRYGYVFYSWGMVPTHEAGFGPHGVFWAVAIAESVLAVAAAVVFRRGRWKAREV